MLCSVHTSCVCVMYQRSKWNNTTNVMLILNFDTILSVVVICFWNCLQTHSHPVHPLGVRLPHPTLDLVMPLHHCICFVIPFPLWLHPPHWLLSMSYAYFVLFCVSFLASCMHVIRALISCLFFFHFCCWACFGICNAALRPSGRWPSNSADLACSSAIKTLTKLHGLLGELIALLCDDQES